jgi:hypothetical protein
MDSTDSDRGKRGGWLNTLYRVLSAPLFITLVGAVLAGYLIPRIASQAEDRRKAREIQASLVQDMSEAAARVVPVGELLATRTIKKEGTNTTAAYNKALLQWEIDRASIEARLKTYFPHASVDGIPLPAAWVDYAKAVRDFYDLSTTELPDRCASARRVKQYLGGNGSPRCLKEVPEKASTAARTARQKAAACDCKKATDWDALSLCDEDSKAKGYERGVDYFLAYKKYSIELLNREDALLNAVRTTTPAGF